MTMKRFTLKGYDGIRCDLFDGNVELAEVHKEDAKELCNLLNELHEENEQIRIILSEYMQQIDKLTIENGKLKGQLKIENYPDFLNSLVEKNEQLSEENKRLVKMLDNVVYYMQKQHKDMPIDDFVE